MCYRENKYIPPGQRNREPMSWGPGRQNSPRLSQSSGGPSVPRPGPHDYSPSSGADQRVVNGGALNKAHTNLCRYLLHSIYEIILKRTVWYWLVSKLMEITLSSTV